MIFLVVLQTVLITAIVISSDLFIGTNNIVAEDYDSLNQSGPNSNTVTVSYVNNADNGSIDD